MSDYSIHHGTKGMKWGIRKYQNTDGSLTPAGKQRYGGGSIAGGVNRLGAKISSVNERHYKKKADKLYTYAKAERGIAGANRRVKNEHLRKADEARARGGIGGHLSSAGHRVAAKVYESNEKWWNKEAAADSAKAKKNRLREGMNRSARKSFEKQAEREDARKEAKFKEKASERAVKKVVDKTANNSDSVRSEKVRKYAARGLAIAGTALAAYGTYKAVKAFNKWSNTPYYDAIGNYVNPKYAGRRSFGSLVRTTVSRARGEAHYDGLGQYVESTKDYLKRANKYAPRLSRR